MVSAIRLSGVEREELTQRVANLSGGQIKRDARA